MNTDTLSTVWPAEDHTLAKHAILRHFLGAWFPILTRQTEKAGAVSDQVLYIDGFAGPGEYAGGEPGSPVIALDVALSHSQGFPKPVRFVLIEQREDRFEHLSGIVGKYKEQIERSKNVILEPLRHGDCDAVLSAILDERETKGYRFGPALAFLDQFGYSAVSMKLIARLMRFPQCETFSYLDYRDMNRWIVDPAKADAFRRAFGTEDWRSAIALPPERRRAFLLETYRKSLREIAKARYVSDFSMADRAGNPLYWLFFCTNHWRGLEEMKKAMWSVDATGNFRFSDKDNPNQLRLLAESFTPAWLADSLERHFKNRKVKIQEIRDYALEHTPCYLYKPALKLLETEGRLERVKGPPRGFADEQMVVEFRKSTLF
jgi:three-Cys-motif partner protein